MTKETINGRRIITKTAIDFVDEFVSLEEVDFADMKESVEKIANELTINQDKKNVKIELFEAEMKTVLSYDI